MITTIISDLGGVLTTPLWDAFVAYGEHCGVPLEEFWTALGELNRRHGTNPMAELECGRMTERAFTDALGAQISAQIDRPVDISDFSEVWFSHLHPNPAMFDLMRRLQADGYRMALLTNNVPEWEQHWRPRMPIDEIFTTIVDSGFVGVRKPDPEIYQLTQERLDVSAQEILFVDDIDVNVTAARRAGWTAVHFQDTAQAITEIEAALSPDPPDAG